MSLSRLHVLCLLLVASALFLSAAEPAKYTIGPDSLRKPGVPRGVITKYTWSTSKLYPGSVRDYWVYVPAQYKPNEKPAAVMIYQDGAGMVREDAGFRTPVVMDNLIAAGDMPVTIGIFINPGVLPPLDSAKTMGRYNRSYEYDALGDRYARFLVDEILPEVRKQYKLSDDPNDYGLAGSSSGASCAFTAAWNRPDKFRRVLSFIGSYTNLRGADSYPDLIRKMEPLPLRVFLQDGENDQNIYAGSWYLANQEMYSALQFAGYDSKFVVGTERHNGNHGSAILPEALRWLWRDYPKPIVNTISTSERQFIRDILQPGSSWEVAAKDIGFADGPAVDRDGNVFFSDIRKKLIQKIAATDGKVSIFKEDAGGVSGLVFGPDGRLYAAENGRKRVLTYDATGKETVLAEGVASNDIAVNAKGDVYFTDPSNKRIWRIDAKGQRTIAFDGIVFPNGIRFSPDQSLLLVSDMSTRFVWSFQVQPDGTLTNGQPFYHLEMPDGPDFGPLRSAADGMTVDTDGYLYVTSNMGIQICDQAGRVVGIISKPQPGTITNVAFGGPDLQTLFVTAGDKVYKRQLRRKGTVSWNSVKPPQPQL